MTITKLFILLSASDGFAQGLGLAFVLFIIWLYYYIRNKNREISHNRNIERNPYNVNEILYAANKNIEYKDWGSAIMNYEKALRIDRNNFEATLILGLIFHSKKEYDKSIPLINKAMAYMFHIEHDSNKMKEISKKYDENIALLFYYYGHIAFMDNDIEKANRFKNLANMYRNGIVLEKNLY